MRVGRHSARWILKHRRTRRIRSAGKAERRLRRLRWSLPRSTARKWIQTNTSPSAGHRSIRSRSHHPRSLRGRSLSYRQFRQPTASHSLTKIRLHRSDPPSRSRLLRSQSHCRHPVVEEAAQTSKTCSYARLVHGGQDELYELRGYEAVGSECEFDESVGSTRS
jgi:hypothetical protein